MDWYKYPIFKLLIPLIAGIASASYFAWLSIGFLPIIIIFSFGILTTFFARFYFSYRFRHLNMLFPVLLFFALGVNITSNYHGYNSPKHYLNQKLSYDAALVEIIEQPEVKKGSLKVVAEILALKRFDTTILVDGKAILYLKYSDSANLPQFGDKIFVANVFQDIQKPLNPGEFDYRSYQERHGILQQAFLKADQWKLFESNSSFSIKATALKIREILLHQLSKNGVAGDEFSVASALLLGYMGDLSDEITTDYRESGAMHILCVSGLHVGIIYMFLSYILGFLKSRRNGKLITLVIIVASVWSFAVISGLSPSVARAATMFTFMAIGKNIKRNISIYNTLAASAFILLIINPFLIFEIGFLLSYAAVISISALHNPVYSLWVPHNKFLDKAWQLAVVSFNAQVGTAPLSIFLFHTFPNYFLITNMVVIPLSFGAFYLGFATIIFSWIPYVGSFLGYLTSLSIRILNSAVRFIGDLPLAVTSDIYINFFQLLVVLAIVISLFWFVQSKKLKGRWLVTSLIFVAVMISAGTLQSFKNKTSRELVIFSTKNNLAIMAKNGDKSLLVVNDYLYENKDKIGFKVQGYSIEYQLNPEIFPSDTSIVKYGIFYSPKLLAFGKIEILMIQNKKDIELVKSLRPDFVLVNNRFLKADDFAGIPQSTAIIFNSFYQGFNAGTLSKTHKIKLLDDGAVIIKI